MSKRCNMFIVSFCITEFLISSEEHDQISGVQSVTASELRIRESYSMMGQHGPHTSFIRVPLLPFNGNLYNLYGRCGVHTLLYFRQLLKPTVGGVGWGVEVDESSVHLHISFTSINTVPSLPSAPYVQHTEDTPVPSKLLSPFPIIGRAAIVQNNTKKRRYGLREV
ncbi:hypothetical protein J6590_023167 [Homalodisca vitripennis]|nr:hypothetical protein J6590_023167 [Homalodisca vitripennis]